MKTTPEINDVIKKSIDTLYQGGILLTHTVAGWGILLDATNENAVDKAFILRKSTDSSDAVLIFHNFSGTQSYFNDIPDVAWDLAEIAENPLIIILPEAKNISTRLTGDDKSIGVLIITDDLTKNICTRFRKPLVFLPAIQSAENATKGAVSVADEIKSGVDFDLTSVMNKAVKKENVSVIKFEKGNKFKIVRE